MTNETTDRLTLPRQPHAIFKNDGHGNLRDPLDAPVGWIAPEVYVAAIERMWAYRRQLVAAGIKPDLETYRRE